MPLKEKVPASTSKRTKCSTSRERENPNSLKFRTGAGVAVLETWDIWDDAITWSGAGEEGAMTVVAIPSPDMGEDGGVDMSREVASGMSAPGTIESGSPQ